MEFNQTDFMNETQHSQSVNSSQVDMQVFSDFDCIDVHGRNMSQSDFKILSDETAITLCHMNIVLWDVVPPVYLLLGTVSNVLSILIWSKQKLAQQTQHVSTLLLWLAIFDLAVLYTALIKHYLKKSRYRLDIQEASDATCKLHEYLIYVSLSCSSWIVAFIAVDRCMTVLCLHPQVKNLTIRVRGRLSAQGQPTLFRRPASLHLAVVGLIATCLTVNAHIFWTQKQSDQGGCRSAIEDYASFLLDVRPKFDLLFAGVLPILVVIVSTLLLILAVCCCHRKTVASCCLCRTRGCAKSVQTDANGAQMAARRGATPSAVSKMSNRITWTLISIAICFIICNVPARVYLMLYPSLPSDANDDPGKYFKYRFTFSLLALLQFLANVINFFIYSVGNELFRKELRKILFKYCTLAHR